MPWEAGPRQEINWDKPPTPQRCKKVGNAASGAQGVRIGVNTILPRKASVFEPKTKWKYEGELVADPHMRSNDPTAIVNADALEQQFDEEEKLGAMMKMPQVPAQDRKRAALWIACLRPSRKLTTLSESFIPKPQAHALTNSDYRRFSRSFCLEEYDGLVLQSSIPRPKPCVRRSTRVFSRTGQPFS